MPINKCLCNFKELKIATDIQGYLSNPQDWNEVLAIEIARSEGITLNEAHWQVLYLVRSFYLQFNTPPTIRMLVKAMGKKYGEQKGNSRYLFRLFPQGPAKQATKIAGVPKPATCL